jgi:hypothetical protein
MDDFNRFLDKVILLRFISNFKDPLVLILYLIFQYFIESLYLSLVVDDSKPFMELA